jgi:septum site-determining protein MinC
MVKAKQKNIRAINIDIDDEREFFDYINKNLPLLNKLLFILNGNITEKIKNYLDSNNICFVDGKNCNFPTSKQEVIIPDSCEKKEKIILYRNIRSGENISFDNDAVIFGRINSGARVISDNNIEIFGDIDGNIECNGDYLILKTIKNGRVSFKDNLLDKQEFNGDIKIISITTDDSLEIRKL